MRGLWRRRRRKKNGATLELAAPCDEPKENYRLPDGWLLCRGLISLQSRHQRPQEHAVEAQLAGGGHLLEQRGAHAQHRHGGFGTNGRSAARAAHVTGLAEAIALVHRAQLLAVAF